ncbi:MAG: RNA polymerase sigma-70 factor [Thermomicrobiales bacterium]
MVGRSERSTGIPGIDATDFESLRRYLFSIAYRLLGSASEAEDIVQDAWLKVHSVPAETIASLKGYLATMVTRQALDQLRSARHRREVYVGQWLPEPVPTGDLVSDPPAEVEREDDLSLGFMILLERLTPEERAAYVLREAFDYPYGDIAEVLQKTAPAVRQLAHRARQHVESGRRRFEVSSEEQVQLAESFLVAARTGDLGQLRKMLAESVVSVSDGGAELTAARRPIEGLDRVSRFIAGGSSKWWTDVEMTFGDINGERAGLFWRGGELGLIMVPEIGDDHVQSLRVILNPDKLAYLKSRLAIK